MKFHLKIYQPLLSPYFSEAHQRERWTCVQVKVTYVSLCYFQELLKSR